MKEPKLRFKEENGMQFPDWEKSKFSDVFDNINNSTFSRDCLNYVDGNVKYIHYGDILTTFDSIVNVEASDVPYVNKDIDFQKYQLLADGDIIVADTAEDDTVGKAVEIVSASNVKVISGLHTIACRPKLKFTSGYLGYYMNSNPYHNQLRPYMQGVKVTSISKANIALTNVSIPSLPEQQKIASLFSEIDTLIQSAEKELEGYRELKQGMLQRMFPKKGEKVPEIRFPEFTGDWGQSKLGDVGNTYTGLSGKTADDFGHGEANFITYMNVYSNNIADPTMVSPIEIDAKQHEVEVGDVFFTTSSETPDEVGMSCVLKEKQGIVYLNSFCFGFRPTKSFDLNFLAYMLRSNYVRNQIKILAQGVSRYNISKAKMMDVSIIFPDYEEQKKIGECFSNLDNLITLHQRELDGYKELKKGLSQQMFC